MSDDTAAAASTETAASNTQSNDVTQTSGTLLGDALGGTDKSGADAAQATATDASADSKSDGAVTYTDFVLPEGVTIDEGAINTFKDLNLSQEAAQRLIDEHSKRQQAVVEGLNKAWAEQNKAWHEEISADPDIGGENLKASLATATRAVEATGIDGFKDVLNRTQAGNIPQLVKAFTQYGRLVEAMQRTGLIGPKGTITDAVKALSSPQFTTGRPVGGAAGKTAAEVLYPSQP